MTTKNTFGDNFGIQAGEIGEVYFNTNKKNEKQHENNHKDFDCFISFSHKNTELAVFLKNIINEYLAPHAKVFVAADGSSISAGKKWADQIRHALGNATVHIILLTPENLTQPWINIEFGAAWSQGIEIIPICFNGLKRDKLPPVLSYYQAVEIPQDIDQLLSSLIKILGQKKPPDQILEALKSEINSTFYNHIWQ